jgi:hypothetical protein
VSSHPTRFSLWIQNHTTMRNNDSFRLRQSNGIPAYGILIVYDFHDVLSIVASHVPSCAPLGSYRAFYSPIRMTSANLTVASFSLNCATPRWLAFQGINAGDISCTVPVTCALIRIWNDIQAKQVVNLPLLCNNRSSFVAKFGRYSSSGLTALTSGQKWTCFMNF